MKLIFCYLLPVEKIFLESKMDSERQNIVNELCGQDTVKSLTTIGGDDNVRTEVRIFLNLFMA